MDQISLKADGVFLWVSLVVSSLLEGLQNRDDISDLQRRIDLLPPDLESLFAAMLQQIPEFYKQNSCELLQIVRSTRQYQDMTASIALSVSLDLITLDLITLAFSDESDPELAIQGDFKGVPYAEIGRRCRNMEDRLKVRTMGLLEVYRLGCPGNHQGSRECGQVQYVHRTVRDYLETPEVARIIQETTEGNDFNPNSSLLRGYIRRLKGNIDHGRSASHFMTAAFMYAHFMELQTKGPNAPLIHELCRVRQHLLVAGDDQRPFHYLALEYGLSSYIDDILKSRKLAPNSTNGLNELPLLYHGISHTGWGKPLPLNDRMISTLLKRGADPNLKYWGQSAWTRALIDANSLSKEAKQDTSLLSACAEVIRIFLEREADPKAVCQISGQRRTARWVVRHTFEDQFPEQAAALDDLFKKRNAKLELSLVRRLRFS